MISTVLKIDPEFQAKIPPLSESEYKQLEENILRDGEVYDPIIVWNGTIIDGHNRYRIIQDNPWLQWRVKEMKFSDKWEAFNWMYANQLGRRNLTDEQKTYLLGKLYEARKHATSGAQKGNQFASKKHKDQNDPDVLPKTTAEIIGEEQGVAQVTVKRAEKFAKGIDAIRAVSPETASDILSGKKEIRKAAIKQIGTAPEPERPALINAVVEGKPLPKQSPPTRPAPPPPQFTKPVDIRSKAGRELMERIHADIEEQGNGKPVEITPDAFAEMLGCDVQAMIERLEEVLTANKNLISKSVAQCVKSSLKQLCNLKEELQNV